MTSSEIREFIGQWVGAWERQDVDALVSCYTEDCTVDSQIFRTIRGRINLRATFLELFRAFFDVSLQVHDIVIDREQDDRAVLVFTLSLDQSHRAFRHSEHGPSSRVA